MTGRHEEGIGMNGNPLTDVLPPQARKYVYALMLLAALALAAWKAAEGDWLEFAGLLLGSLGFGTAASNTNTPRGGAIEPPDDMAG